MLDLDILVFGKNSVMEIYYILFFSTISYRLESDNLGKYLSVFTKEILQ